MEATLATELITAVFVKFNAAKKILKSWALHDWDMIHLNDHGAVEKGGVHHGDDGVLTMQHPLSLSQGKNALQHTTT